MSPPPSRRVWKVREITGAIARRFEDLPSVWVEAEVQNTRRRGGQVYFSLHDEHQIDASMNAIVWDRLPTPPRDGTLLHAYGRVEYWAERSQVRMRVERLELVGRGLLEAQIAAVRAGLQRDGLTDPARRRSLPLLPRRVGLITSAAGAARQDVLRNLWERFPADVVFHDVPVQGEGAPEAIAAAVSRVSAMAGVDVLIVTRGGGSLEDLMAFNSEAVCRAVAACRVPVVSAVGHERDVTLCDEVADLRVSTPTAAARAVVPDHVALVDHVASQANHLNHGLRRQVVSSAERLDALRRGLGQGLRLAEGRSERHLDGLVGRLGPAARGGIGRASSRVDAHRDRLGRAIGVRLREVGVAVESAATLLDAVGPTRTVARGYAIVRDAETDQPVVSRERIPEGTDVTIQLRDGRRTATITKDRT
ncbi:MAG: exodeoxyribonuclease VII large subunit [Thermoleophilia bacterium]|nr:exodeoxyribonuclease VII large subunit [Thermoleophilia bacterium]